MLFRIFMVCISLAIAFAAYEIVKVRNFYARLADPAAAFTVKNHGNHSGPALVEFINYDCGPCKDTHLVFLEYAARHTETDYVARPVPFSNGSAEQAAKMALAAGLQGKFWEMDRALSEHRDTPDETFFREAAALYGMNYERMVADSQSDRIYRLAKDNAHAAMIAGIKSTPAFMVGKTIYQPDNALTADDLDRMVREEKEQR